MQAAMTPQAVEALFTRSTGQYLCARWDRPIVPVVFGVEDATLSIVKGAIEAVVALAGHRMADTDVELGANLMVFFVRDWSDLTDVPQLLRLVDGLPETVARLQAAGANQYRVFRFDPAGAIRAAFVFIRMDDDLAQVPAEVLALSQAVQVIVLWSDTAFQSLSPLAEVGGRVILRPEIGALIRAVYDPVLPAVTQDPTHAYRLVARMNVT
ncbi:MAG: hypothetical protein Q7J57_05410 [Gemmobacter sp.]|nr:hypothetical protein [Gemmobacter sp.]